MQGIARSRLTFSIALNLLDGDDRPYREMKCTQKLPSLAEVLYISP